MVTKLSKAEWRAKFDQFDKDGDNTISLRELKPLMQYMGFNPTDHDVKKLMEQMGKIETDNIDFDKFYEYMSQQPDPFNELMDAFSFFDKDGNGFIDKEEFQKILSSGMVDYSEEEMENLFELVDENQDKKIEYKEFVKLFVPEDMQPAAPSSEPPKSKPKSKKKSKS